MNVLVYPRQLGAIDFTGGGFDVGGAIGGLMQVGTQTLQAKWAADLQKSAIRSDRAIGLAQQQTAQAVGLAEQQRLGVTGSAWAEAAPKIALGVGAALVALVAVKMLMGGGR